MAEVMQAEGWPSDGFGYLFIMVINRLPCVVCSVLVCEYKAVSVFPLPAEYPLPILLPLLDGSKHIKYFVWGGESSFRRLCFRRVEGVLFLAGAVY